MSEESLMRSDLESETVAAREAKQERDITSYEIVYSLDSPPEKIELGLFVIRGDNVAIIADGLIGGSGKDTEMEDVRAEPINEIAGNR